jgi:hypothetical protein
MKNTILVAGLACLSVVAVAQSDANAKKEQAPSPAPVASSTASPRDTATGQSSGKRMHKPITVTAEVGLDATAKDAAKSTVTNKSAQDDWQAKSAASSTPQIKRVATGDVNGDGAAKAAAPSSGQASGQNASQSNIQSPRDLATGQASGKRTHQPAASTAGHDSDPAPKK